MPKTSPENNNIKNLVIVGGGTAGWMAAAALSKIMGESGLNIRLIESDKISTVGVGEASIPEICVFNRLIGIDENEFMRATQATFKLGIEFENWGGLGESYFHPFGSYGINMEGIRFHHFWQRMKQQGDITPLSDYCLQTQAARTGKFMRAVNIARSPLERIRHAFHFDAGLYAKFLRKFSEGHGVTRTQGKVVQVKQNGESGFIERLIMEDGQTIEGDFFIDCTGFFGLLIDKTLKSGFEDWSDYLPMNSAVTVGTAALENPPSHTKSTAYSAGWQWRIPLQNRTGNGFVYCDKYIDDDAALKHLLSHIDGEPLGDPFALKFTTGMRSNVWNKNCLALGLSAGFLEPLESTGIHMIQSGIARLMTLLPNKNFNPVDIAYYNKVTRTEFERIRDFIILHYKATQRDDSPFWNYCREMDIPDHLQEKLDLYAGNGHIFKRDNELFGEDSWLAVMHGQNIAPSGYHPVADILPKAELEQRLKEIRATVFNSEAQMPSHAQFIAQNCTATKP